MWRLRLLVGLDDKTLRTLAHLARGRLVKFCTAKSSRLSGKERSEVMMQKSSGVIMQEGQGS